MNFYEIKLYTQRNNLDNLGGQLALADILGYEEVDPEADADFLRTHVNDGTGYADYVEDSLLTPLETRVHIKLYLAEGEADKLAFIDQLDTNQTTHGIEAIERKLVNSADWENKWREHYKPMEIGQDVVIVPVWETYTGTHSKVFKIEPGHLFGTGLHQSTQGCIEQLEIHAPNQRLLDLGCGTGVLGIIGLLCGAKHATLVDIEPMAPTIVGENAALNGVANHIDVHVGNVLADDTLASQLVSQGPYGVITANIVADIIIAMLPFIQKALAAGGHLIMAGIIDEREHDVISALQSVGYTLTTSTYKDNWVCLVAQAPK